MRAGLLPPLAALVVTLVGAAPPAIAQPSDLTVEERQRLGQADEAFRFQDYERVIKLLRPLLDDDRVRDTRELQTLRERLGASYWFVGAQDAARTEFGALLKTDPSYELDKLYYPATLVTFFEDHKKWLTDAGFLGGPPGPDSVLTGPRRTWVKSTTVRRMPAIAYLMPFGVGQFANDDRAKGAVVAVLQGIGIALNVGGWLGVEALKRGGSNNIAAADAGRADLLRALWWTGTGLFSATWVYSVADGFASRPPRESTKQGWEFIDPSELRPSGPSAGVELRWDPGPTGVGLGLSGSF